MRVPSTDTHSPHRPPPLLSVRICTCPRSPPPTAPCQEVPLRASPRRWVVRLFWPLMFHRSGRSVLCSSPKAQAKGVRGRHISSSRAASWPEEGPMHGHCGLCPHSLSVHQKHANTGPYLEGEKVRQLPEHLGPEQPAVVLQQSVQACTDCAHRQKRVFTWSSRATMASWCQVRAVGMGRGHEEGCEEPLKRTTGTWTGCGQGSSRWAPGSSRSCFQIGQEECTSESLLLTLSLSVNLVLHIGYFLSLLTQNI